MSPALADRLFTMSATREVLHSPSAPPKKYLFAWLPWSEDRGRYMGRKVQLSTSFHRPVGSMPVLRR